MLWHVIMLLIQLGTKGRTGRTARKRRRKGRKVVIDCPACSTLGLAREFFLETRDRTQSRWVKDLDLYQCDGCHREHNAEAFANNGDGVLTVKLWDCLSCGHNNLATEPYCRNCSKPV